MSQDPFYEQILAGLNGPLNPQDFEEVVGNLVREMFPGFVPVRGGKDSGMDGAIAGSAEPFPVVITTAKDVRRNLEKSLDSFVERKQPARDVVFVTSQTLTPQDRLKLMDLARGRGFTLRQVIEQRDIVDFLYRNPHQCKKLLGLSGQPSALSVVPRSRRPLLDLEPIGRERDLEWLRNATGDRILSGEPGSGKTFLLYHLARDGWGLFLVDPDGEIAGALREQRPGVVIVDDAHVQPGVLEKLRHLRQETGMAFSIVATTWEGGRDQVVEALGGIPEDRVRKLELLTRAEILEVFRAAGVDEDPDTMRYLIDQAANKPGLAVTIATLWLEGSWREVIDGKVLSRTLLGFFQEFVGREATDVLAAFSLGGDAGLEVEAVRDFLGLSRLQIRQIGVGLAAGGVLSEAGRDALAVWPRPLRSALIRTVFFPPPGQPRHSYEELLNSAPSLSKATDALIAAKALGAEVPLKDLQQLVLRFGSARAWNGLARLSEAAAVWVLENYPGDPVHVGGSALLRAPQMATKVLLERAVSSTGPIHSNPDHPMRILSDWVRELNIPGKERVARRRILAKTAKRYIGNGGEASVGIHGICLALSPSLESGSLDPAAGRVFTMSWGLLPVDQLRELAEIWQDVRDAVTSIDTSSWEHLTTMLWEWIYPDYSARSTEVPEETEEEMHSFATRVLQDLVPLMAGSPGFTVGLRDLAARINLELPLGQDPDFEVLYPSEDYEGPEDWKIRQENQRKAVNALAARWKDESPLEIARKVVEYEEEAKRIKRSWPRLTPSLSRDLAAVAPEPEIWLDAFLQENAPPDLVEPFLRATGERKSGHAEQVLDYCLRSGLYTSLVIELVLEMPEPPSYFLEKVLEQIPEFTQLVETLCLRGQVSLTSLRALLDHPSWEVALAAATGEWLTDPEKQVRKEVAKPWRDAILRSRPGEHSRMRYWLGEIFGDSADLAFDWIHARLQEGVDRFFLADEGPFAKAVASLSEQQRIVLLDYLGESQIPCPLVSMVINKSPQVYRELLNRRNLSSFHLEPLAGVPDTEWVELAILALTSGYETKEVAQAAFYVPGVSVWWGPQSKHWNQWDEAFARLEEDERGEIQEVAHEGRQRAQGLVQQAIQEERQEEINGT